MTKLLEVFLQNAPNNAIIKSFTMIHEILYKYLISSYIIIYITYV